MSQRAAIVTTLRDAGATIKSFVSYHLAIGFEHIYLFFDDPTDTSADIIAHHPAVTVTLNDPALQTRWRSTRLFQLRYRNAQLYKMDRQQLNVAVATEMALANGINWLLHIDCDELFYAPQFFEDGVTVGQHFQQVADKNLAQVTYLNVEGVPESAEIDDYFKSVTLFRARWGADWQLTPAQADVAASFTQMPENGFYHYRRGKSAALVSAELLPDGVHDFLLPEQQGRFAKVRRKLANSDRLEQLNIGNKRKNLMRQRLLASQHQRHMIANNPSILHYASCGFEHFWRKYTAHNHYNNRANPASIETISRFHKNAHEIGRNGDKEAGLAFYRVNFAIEDLDLINKALQVGIFKRITDPADYLKKTNQLV